MHIREIVHHPADELVRRLRQVPLLHQPDRLVYQQALISLELIHPNSLCPTQNYVWLQELRKVQELRWSLREHGVDLFRLEGFVTYTVRLDDGSEVSYDVYPPIVEESLEADGTLVALINDGMHRLYLARTEWVVPQVVYVRGVPQAYPYYAYPRQERWQGLDLLADNPDPRAYVKKSHRRRDYRSLFRDFQAVFQNVGRSRSALLTAK